MTRLPTVEVDEPPSPFLSAAPFEEEDHDDDLSINSSDLDEEGWLNVDNTDAASAVTSTASVLGSSVISDLANSTREPSEASDSEDEDDVAFELNPKAGFNPHESLHEDTETPAASKVHEFKNSWIFPDPTSSNASLTASGTATDNTPKHSIPNIGSVPPRSVGSFIQEDDSEGSTSLPSAPVALAMPAPDSKQKTAPGNPFLAHAPSVEGNRWTVLAILIGLLLILAQLGPWPLDLVSIMSRKWESNFAPAVPYVTPPAQNNLGLGSAGLEIVKDALAILTTSSDAAPKDVPTEAVTTPTEYSYRLGKLRKGGKTSIDLIDTSTDLIESSTDLIETPSTNFLVILQSRRRKACQCPPQQCECPPSVSILNHLVDRLVMLDAYARWMSDVIAGPVYHAGLWVRNEVRLEVKHQRELVDAFVKSPTVRVIVESVVNSPKTVARFYQHARDRVFANGRCDRAADVTQQAQTRGWSSILQARRGLDVASSRGQQAVDAAKTAGRDFLNSAIAGACSASKRYADKNAEKKVRARGGRGGGCKAGKKRWRRSCKGKGKKGGLQCGFRGYGRDGRGCDVRGRTRGH